MQKWLLILSLTLANAVYAQEQPKISFVAIKDTEEPISAQMNTARTALDAQDYATAITILNSVLLTPPNQYTQEAQERIGFAYEHSGKPIKAMAEYRAYIAMYPKSENIERIRRRLLALEINDTQHDVAPQAPGKPRVANESDVRGSVSSYLIASGHDMSLISNTSVLGDFKRDEYTTKIVIRENAKNIFNDPSKTKYTLNQASIEVIDTYRNMGIKIGRQNPGNGILGKYDGVELSYGKDVEYKLYIGTPSLKYSATNRTFFGGSRQENIGPFSYTLYYNQQLADGFVERSAIGGNFSYFKDGLSGTLMTEYDIAYKQLNSVTFQGRNDSDTGSYYVLYDRRKSPVLYGEKALQLGLQLDSRMPYNSVNEALVRSGFSRDQLYDYIVAETATSTSLAIGRSVNRGDWTFAADYQFSTLSGINSSPDSSTVNSISFTAINPKLIKGHSFTTFTRYSTGQNGSFSFTLLDSTHIGTIRLDAMLMLTSTQTKSLTLSTHYPVMKDGSMEIMLMMNKFRDTTDKTLIIGFRYDF